MIKKKKEKEKKKKKKKKKKKDKILLSLIFQSNKTRFPLLKIFYVIRKYRNLNENVNNVIS